MKNIFTSLFGVSLLTSASMAQFDTTGGMYYNAVYASATKTSDIVYGSNTTYTGSTVSLTMDIYQPSGDTHSLRPLIIFAHGGSFIGGTKTDQDVVELCNRFSKMGYVTASIYYRLGMYPFDSVNATKAVIRATQDMKAAVRFFKKDAATTNSYKIDPKYIYAGGSSAGAFMALHLGYLDKMAEATTVLSSTTINSLGGLEGNSGNPGYTSTVSGVINLCGALGDSTWLEPGDIPFVSLHGNNDQTVPYGKAKIYINGTYPIMVVSGSSAIKARAINVAVDNPFFTYQGADHTPYGGTSATAIAYMDTTVNFVKEFLRPLLAAPAVVAVVNVPVKQETIGIYPNPAKEFVNFSFGDPSKSHSIELCDMTGGVIRKQILTDSKITISFDLPQGIYFVKIYSEGDMVRVAKVCRM